MTSIKTIAIDLTPILPGGENGGAKIFVLELIVQLAILAPETQFLLLTQAAAHNELKSMECSNIKCLMIRANSVRESSGFSLLTAFIKKFPYLSGRASALGCRLHTLLKRRKASSFLQDTKIELLFCPFTAPTYYEPNIPTVCTIYDLQYKTYPAFFTIEEVNHRNHTFVEACRKASMLTAISEYSRQSAITHGQINPEKIRTIHLKMAHRILPKTHEHTEILERLNLKAQQYFLYPANFWKHKNHEMLLTAFGIACQNKFMPEIKLVCTGAAVERLSWLQKAAESMNLSERVLFPGFLTHTELATLMANSKGVIFPSLYEGFGLPIIEAMAAGVPVACSNLTALPEIAGEAALLFNPRIPTELAEAIVDLNTNEVLRERLIRAGRKRAEFFSDAKQMAQEYWDLFQRALEEKRLA